MMKTSPYTILECDRSDSFSTIKAKYRKLLLKHHPDKNGGTNSDKFVEINQAFKCLASQKSKSIVVDFRQTAKNLVFKFLMMMKPRDIVLNVKVTIDDIYFGVTKKITYIRFKGGVKMKDAVYINLHNFENKYTFKSFGDENPIANTRGDLHINVSIDYQQFTNCHIDDILDEYNLTASFNIDLHEYFMGLRDHHKFIVQLPEFSQHIPHINGMSFSLPNRGLPFETDEGIIERGNLTILLYLNMSYITKNLSDDPSFCNILRKYFTAAPSTYDYNTATRESYGYIPMHSAS